MLLQRLYRYVFCDWATLSAQEIQEAPSFFKTHINKPKFQAALKELQAQKLYDLFYEDAESISYYHIQDDEDLRFFFQSRNTNHHYFKDQDLNRVFLVYQKLCQFFFLHQFLTNAPNDIYVPSVSYQILVFFGDDSLENILGSLEKYFLNKEESPYSLLEYPLSREEANLSIDLIAWRKLLLSEGLSSSIKLFALAPEIEKTLVCAPKTLDEALNGAQKRSFESHEEHKEFAEFCVKNLISEQLFNNCLNTEVPDLLYNSLQEIIKQLQPTKYDDLIQLMPTSGLTCFQISKLLKTLKSNQLQVIERLSSQLPELVKNYDGLSIILDSLHSTQSQQALIKHLDKEIIQAWMKKSPYFFFSGVLKKINEDFREGFIRKIINLDNLRQCIDSSYLLENFMGFCLPKQGQTVFIENTIGIEAVRTLSTSHCDIVSQLKCLVAAERFDYLKNVIGRDTLNQSLDKNWCMLTSVLKQIPKNQRLDVLFDVMGADSVHEIIPI